MEATFAAFIPAIVAIVLALITKQVYISLFIGVLTGSFLYSGGNPLHALRTMYNLMSEKVGDNAPILVFLVILGIFVVLMQKSGGNCNHIDHVNTQLLYASIVAVISLIAYIIAGFVVSSASSVLTIAIMWVTALMLFAAIITLLMLSKKSKKNTEMSL